jgi:hypothetical protein
MGFSMLAWPEGPHTVFNALIDSFFADIEPTAADQSFLAASPSARSDAPRTFGGIGGHESSPASEVSPIPEGKGGKGGKPKKRHKKGGGGGGKDGGSGSGVADGGMSSS